MIKFLQSSVITQTELGGGSYIFSYCKFPVVYVCQKL